MSKYVSVTSQECSIKDTVRMVNNSEPDQIVSNLAAFLKTIMFSTVRVIKIIQFWLVDISRETTPTVIMLMFNKSCASCYEYFIKLKLPVLVGPLSAVQPPFDILTSPGDWATLGKWRSGLPGETISLNDFVCSQLIKLLIFISVDIMPVSSL